MPKIESVWVPGIMPVKLSLDEMWEFIDNLIRPNELASFRKILSHEDVFVIYSKLAEFDQVFRELLQVRLLQKETDKEKP